MGNEASQGADGWDRFPDVEEPYTPKTSGVYQDMTLPLSSYYISSGHNSYLSGDQVASVSNTKTIEKCLKLGCRVIELDIYNKQINSRGPVCKHGNTFTKAVSLRTCVQSINNFAFTASPYPVIITIENHTDYENQKDVAAIFAEELGEKLYIPPPEVIGKTWLSPEDLKGKVLIRGKVLKDGHPDLMNQLYVINKKFKSFQAMNDKDTVGSASIGESTLLKISEPVMSAAFKKHTANNTMTLVSRNDATFTGKGSQVTLHSSNPAEGEEENSTSSLPRLSEESVQEPVRVESGFLPPAGSLGELIDCNNKHLVRIYPSNWRVDSSNYNPISAWSLGASIAALNWQVWDKGMWINEARFMDNGGCGYVIKPPGILTIIDYDSHGSIVLPPPRHLKVHVLSAQIPDSLLHRVAQTGVQVAIEVAGLPVDDCIESSDRVKRASSVNVDVDWTFSIHYPDSCVLLVYLIDVWRGNVTSDVHGYFSLPLSNLREGSFKLHMRCKSGKPLEGAWVKVILEWIDGADE